MNIEFKFFNEKHIVLYKIIKFILWISIITVILISIFIDMNKPLFIAANIGLGILIILEIITFYNKVRRANKVSRYIASKEYKQGINYLESLTKKKRSHKTNEEIAYFLGIIYLKIENLEMGEYYLKKAYSFKNSSHWLYLANYAFYLLCLIYLINDEKEKLNEIKNDYQKYISQNNLKIIKNKKIEESFENLHTIIKNLEEGNKEEALIKLKNNDFSDIPFIKKYLENNLKDITAQ